MIRRSKKNGEARSWQRAETAAGVRAARLERKGPSLAMARSRPIWSWTWPFGENAGSAGTQSHRIGSK
jgi:hypothetical protein